MDKINKLVEEKTINKSWLYYFQNAINKAKEDNKENYIVNFINSNEFNYLYFSLNSNEIRVIIISKTDKNSIDYLNKGILFPVINNNNYLFWKYMLQIFYKLGSIVWLVSNIRCKNNDVYKEKYENIYSSIKEITKSSYIYKINPKIKINITIKEDGSEYGGITNDKQLICNHYLRQLFQKEIEW